MVLPPPKVKWALAALVSGIIYFLLAYTVQRTDSIALQLCFALLFSAMLALRKADLKWLLGLGIIFRLIFIAALPALSDDFYRFIWDGLLWHHGAHPFSHQPAYYMQPGQELPGLSAELFQGLNSKEYFTVYPPLHQAVFWLGTLGYNGAPLQAVVIMRVLLIAFDVLLLFLMAGWLRRLSKPQWYLSFYALNPLVIVEVSGNLHFEGMMAFFLLLATFALGRRKVVTGSLALGAAVATKLTPLIAGPLLMLRAGRKNWWKVVAFAAIGCAAMFAPLLDADWLMGQSLSLDLYFRKFEFNASFYYLLREVGFWWKGYNTIATMGPRLAATGGVLILVLSWVRWPKNRSVFQGLTIIFFVYYLTATTVHPWYVVPLVALSVFSGYLFPVVWSYCVVWSYWGYTETGYDIPWLAIFIEYAVVIGVFLGEVVLSKRTKIRL